MLYLSVVIGLISKLTDQATHCIWVGTELWVVCLDHMLSQNSTN